ncbi:MAG: GNAT family N-acetyltransferase [Flavobacteriales bacterium]|nr:GNAT family N-acetyltransferase [Flavobacteriales bacterium]|tara:strand:+ start:3266 stop:3784 length:519 start_codon:yes stop_codon:yes gene_type:complete
MLLSGEKVSLRALEPSDLDLIYSWENNPDIWEISHTLAPFSKFVLTQYLKTQHLDIYSSKQLRLVIMDKTNSAIGLIDLFDFDPKHRRAGVGILVDSSARGKGCAHEALELIETYCFNHLDFNQIYANIGFENTVSLKLFESLGYQKVGVKKDWIKTSNGFIDEILYQKINN